MIIYGSSLRHLNSRANYILENRVNLLIFLLSSVKFCIVSSLVKNNLNQSNPN